MNYSVLILGACVKILVFIELLILVVIVVAVCDLDMIWRFFSSQCALAMALPGAPVWAGPQLTAGISSRQLLATVSQI